MAKYSQRYNEAKSILPDHDGCPNLYAHEILDPEGKVIATVYTQREAETLVEHLNRNA